jgi:hypothetical protein
MSATTTWTIRAEQTAGQSVSHPCVDGLYLDPVDIISGDTVEAPTEEAAERLAEERLAELVAEAEECRCRRRELPGGRAWWETALVAVERTRVKAIWFSRHQPSREQIKDAAYRGYDLVVTETGTSLGAMNLGDDGDVRACVSGLMAHCAETGAVAIFGVFAAPILAQLARTAEDIRQRGEYVDPEGGHGDFPCFAAWKVKRSQEGGKPTFEHRGWVAIGRLNQASCGWL